MSPEQSNSVDEAGSSAPEVVWVITLPSGCSMNVDPVSSWSLTGEITHHTSEDTDSGERACRDTGKTDAFLIADYLKIMAYCKYKDTPPLLAGPEYRNDDSFNAFEANLLLHAQAGRLGLAIDSGPDAVGEIWDKFPDCIPTGDVLEDQKYDIPAGMSFRSETRLSDGTTRVFEGWTLGPGGCAIRDVLAEIEARERESEGCRFCEEMPWKALRTMGLPCRHGGEDCVASSVYSEEEKP